MTMRLSLLVSLAFFALYGVIVVQSSSPEDWFDWVVSYGTISPFGVPKKVIMINNEFPGPLINSTTNNVVHVNVHNNLDEPFLFTWNGVQMRRNSWNDGVQGTNCPIMPGKNWTYYFQMKDQIGSFFYYPSVNFQRAAGGYGPIRINNRDVIPIPFPFPRDDFDILISDWFDKDYQEMRNDLDAGNTVLPSPDGVLINGKPSKSLHFNFEPGKTYRLRISNVGVKTTLSFRIQGHDLILIETEGSYTLKKNYTSLDIHPGQSYSVLVTADVPGTFSYNMIACTRFVSPVLCTLATVDYTGSNGLSPYTFKLPHGPRSRDFNVSMQQAQSIRWDLDVGAARPNPQGSYHYGQINVTRTIVLQNEMAVIDNHTRYTVNGISFVYSNTPLKLADYFRVPNVFFTNLTKDRPDGQTLMISTPVIDALYRDFIQIVFQNKEDTVQTWHVDGYNFFVVGMGFGEWDESKRSEYNLKDAVWRTNTQVYPNGWTAVWISLDNMGMWSIRSMNEERRYLGQEVYIRVRGEDPMRLPDPRDEMPIPNDLPLCGRALPLWYHV
ncbi:L-ascorbate oxidase homolog [Asparagus officinalis]|uniref:L-ascorbate oxidase homolog n=1 Tax=Asparagus officinalis TaxID=4686 RepID=UPI00098E4CDF|nr:L-ascorbate oxidase homolog [Asparagus officinalis]